MTFRVAFERREEAVVIYSGLKDRRFKKGWRGEIIEIDHTGKRLVGYIYGDTLEEMREIKHAVRDFLEARRAKKGEGEDGHG